MELTWNIKHEAIFQVNLKREILTRIDRKH
jgi:hypothetical protein